MFRVKSGLFGHVDMVLGAHTGLAGRAGLHTGCKRHACRTQRHRQRAYRGRWAPAGLAGLPQRPLARVESNLHHVVQFHHQTYF